MADDRAYSVLPHQRDDVTIRYQVPAERDFVGDSAKVCPEPFPFPRRAHVRTLEERVEVAQRLGRRERIGKDCRVRRDAARAWEQGHAIL